MKTYPHVVSSPDICHGKPVITGTRVMVWQILELLEAGVKQEDIRKEFPTLPRGSIEAALHFAAQRAKLEHYVSFSEQTNSQVFT